MATRGATLKNVVVADDRTAGGLRALDRAAWLPFAPGGTLHAVHAIGGDPPPELRPALVDRAREEVARRGEAAVAALARRAGPEPSLRTAVLVGEAFAHALLGSVAEWLVRSATCDVAITRPARFTFELP